MSNPSRFGVTERVLALHRMQEEEFDLAVIGGGITGAGVARDAASRGMKVALVEAGDFAQGTSSRSSKLIHGGIRYLENFEFHLVFEALSERRLLFEMAPHLVHPLRFLLPIFAGGRVGMFKMGMGMWLYDMLSLFESPEMHEKLDSKESLARVPELRARGLLGSYVYSDAYMDDDRLVLETLRSAKSMGAACANFCRADKPEFAENGKMRALQCVDLAPGASAASHFRIKAKHFVSTLGPWTDRQAEVWFKDWQKILRTTKGVHLTFSRKRLPLDQAVVMAAENESRIVFAIPRNDMVILGTTDTDENGDPNQISVKPQDVQYLLEVAGDYFPNAKLTAQDVIASYAGVRPLVRDDSANASKTSREHLILSDPRNITFVAGGKYTTYRRMAEDTLKKVLENFPVEDRIRFRLNSTTEPLNDLATADLMDQAMRESEMWAKEFSLSRSSVQWLIGRHGFEALQMLRGEALSERGTRSRKEAPEVRMERERWRLAALEAKQAMQNSLCMRLIDFYLRRMPLYLADTDHGLSKLTRLGDLFARELGWSDQRKQDEIRSVQSFVTNDLAWKQAF